jgi:hypothetical protein
VTEYDATRLARNNCRNYESADPGNLEHLPGKFERGVAIDERPCNEDRGDKIQGPIKGPQWLRGEDGRECGE